MSLDVYLDLDAPIERESQEVILVRRAGATVEISRSEWDDLCTGREPATIMRDAEPTRCVYQANITHNLTAMAAQAGIYFPLWRPDEVGVTKARQLIDPLSLGLDRLKGAPDKYMAYNPKNGWGSYELLVRFVEDYVAACREYPDASVRVWR